MNRKKANCTPKSQSYQRLNRNESSANRSQNSTPTSAKVRARGRIDDSIDLTLASDSGGNSLQSTENLVGTTIKNGQNQVILLQTTQGSSNQIDRKFTIPIFHQQGTQQTVQFQLVPQGTTPQGQQILIAQPVTIPTNAQTVTTDASMATLMDFIVQQQKPACSTTPIPVPSSTEQQLSPNTSAEDSKLQSPRPHKFAIATKCRLTEAEKAEKDALKKAKQAEAARMRYHRLSPEEKKALNLRRTYAQKRKRQRERELAELEIILRSTNDIVDDPSVIEQLREKRMRARWAEAARTRYQRMSAEERKDYNNKRRARLNPKNDKGEAIEDDDALQQKIKDQNERKAEAARLRYHRMSKEEKKLYNQRRTESFRRRRMEEEKLLAMPIGRINGEALDRAQQIVLRNAKRAEAARLRYQRMTPDQRREYNKKRYRPRPKKELKLLEQLADMNDDENSTTAIFDDIPTKQEQEDTLSFFERDVIRRTQQAKQILLRQQANTASSASSGTATIIL